MYDSEDIIMLVNRLIYYTSKTIWQTYKRNLESLKAEKPVLTEGFPVIKLKNYTSSAFKHTGQDFRTAKGPSPDLKRLGLCLSKTELGERSGVYCGFSREILAD